MKLDYAKNEYTFSYRFGGKTWTTNVWADSPEEAKQKVRAMATATFDGEVAAKIYIPVNISWVRNLCNRFKKLMSGKK